ncbi:MAG: zinc ribbon domain-containing protein [Treponema sp.]|nr:zinc ribbon domain-containing protein [Treponema sp.]
MTCPRCDEIINKVANFCPNCGEKINGDIYSDDDDIIDKIEEMEIKLLTNIMLNPFILWVYFGLFVTPKLLKHIKLFFRIYRYCKGRHHTSGYVSLEFGEIYWEKNDKKGKGSIICSVLNKSYEKIDSSEFVIKVNRKDTDLFSVFSAVRKIIFYYQVIPQERI